MVFHREDYRHPGMKLGHQFVRVASNDGAGVKPLADGQILPSLLKTSKHEREVILHANRKRHLRSTGSTDLSPLIKAISGNEASSPLESLPERWRRVDRFTPRVDCPVGDPLIL